MTPQPTVWPIVISADAAATIRFAIDALGFEEVLVVRDGEDSTRIVHSQLAWPPGGGVMISSAGDGTLVKVATPASLYLVVDSDAEVDRIHRNAVAAGATEALAPTDQDYGGRGSSLIDAQGNTWSIGSYRGEPH